MFRLATAQERDHYETTLYPLQDRVLALAEALGPDVVLTGGTALSRFYLHHRLSDDLDLFSASGDIPNIARYLAAEIDAVRIERMSPAFARLLVGERGDLKVDVVRDDIRLDPPERRTSPRTYLHTLHDIAVNKISAFEDRVATKDAVDLYFIANHFDFDRLFADADCKRIPPDYDQMLRLATQPLEGDALLLMEPLHFERFLSDLRARVLENLKKKVLSLLATDEIPSVIASLLWDAPKERRRLLPENRALVLERASSMAAAKREAVRFYLGEQFFAPLDLR
jgi:hypothetical protein